MVSQGVPMILGGDEFLRTQHGNNNAWCQDNPTSWVDWSLRQRNADFVRFVRMMIALRKAHPDLEATDVLHRRARRPTAGNPLARHRAGPARFLVRQPFAGLRPRRPALGPAQPDRSGHLRRDELLSRATRLQDPGRADRSPMAAVSSIRRSIHPRTSFRKTKGRTFPSFRFIACKPTRSSSSFPKQTWLVKRYVKQKQHVAQVVELGHVHEPATAWFQRPIDRKTNQPRSTRYIASVGRSD